MARGRHSNSSKKDGATLGFEATLWIAADKPRNNMDAAEYKHVVLGHIFLKYISDAFEERHNQLLQEIDQGADPEDPDEYRADNIFWVPQEALWSFVQVSAKRATFNKKISSFMERILSNLQESRTLCILRNALLPKLLSGEIRLKDSRTLGEANQWT